MCTSFINYSSVFLSVTAVAVTIIEQVDDDGVAMCNDGHRHINYYWTAVDGCNECKCAKSAASDVVGDKTAVTSLVTCTNLWCGPVSFDCLSGVMPCTGTNQVTYYKMVVLSDFFG